MRRALANFVPPHDKGQPLLTPRSRKLVFVIDIRAEGDPSPLPSKVEFDAARPVRGGQAVF